MKVRDCFDLNTLGNTSRYTDFINYIDTSSVNEGALSSIAFLEKEFPSRAQRLIKHGDILYSSVRPNLRHYYFYNDSFSHAVASTGFVLLRNKSNYNTRFAYYYLATNEVVKHLSNIAELSQSTFPSFAPKDIGKIDLPDIDRANQDKIVSILYAYDNLIEVNTNRIKVLEQMAENLYKEWFVRFRFPGHENAKFENGIPKGWRIEKVGKLCSIITGKKDANEATGNGEYPFFTCARETTLSTDEFILDTDAILIAGNGSYTGFVKKYSGKFDLYQRTYALFSFVDVEWLFLYWTLKIEFEREYMGGSHGSAIPYITKPNIEKFKIMVPTMNLQKKCQELFEKIHLECNRLEKLNANLCKQRDLLLPRLVSGKLEIAL